METKVFQKFCPACKLSNDANAHVCEYCGAPLKIDILDTQGKRAGASVEASEPIREKSPGEYKSPPKGLAFFILNKTEPFALRTEEEFVIGRAEGGTSEALLDLTDQDGFAFGVSRRHAMIRSGGDKYVLIDLNSSNGTWLNGQLLIPTQPYDLPSGSVIQLGRLKLVTSYNSPPSGRK